MNEREIILTIALTTIIILLLIVGIFLIGFLLNKQRLHHDVQVQVMKMSYERALRNVETEVRDSLLQHISREMQHNVQLSLSNLALQLEYVKRQRHGSSSQLMEIEQTITETSQQLRNLYQCLDSNFVGENSFITAVQLEVERLKRLGKFNVRWEYDSKEPKLNNDRLLIVFRILQELVSNILKHAQAKNISISLRGFSPFTLEIMDDGVGFQMNEKFQGSNGLQNMFKRAAMADMKFFIESSSGKGCRCFLSEV